MHVVSEASREGAGRARPTSDCRSIVAHSLAPADKNAPSQVDFLQVDVTLPWGWNVVRPLAGSLKGFPYELLTLPLDLQRRSVSLPWGAELPWNVTGTGPFFGGMGVAPPPHMGRVSSVSPWAAYGGNLDNKNFGAGCTVYFPVNVPGECPRSSAHLPPSNEVDAADTG
jgi:hypothetical protein